MTLGRASIIFLLTLGVFVSCNKKQPQIIAPGANQGYRLSFYHSPCDTVTLISNSYFAESVANLECPDLSIRVVCYESLLDSALKQYYSKGNEVIETNIRDFIRKETGEDYDGMIPNRIQYRTEACSDMHISIYDSNDHFISDVTDIAQFHYIYDKDDPEDWIYNLLISSKDYTVSKISIGTSIKDYLSFNPLIFGEAHFIFPGLDKQKFYEGYYFKIEISLENGKVITGTSIPTPPYED